MFTPLKQRGTLPQSNFRAVWCRTVDNSYSLLLANSLKKWKNSIFPAFLWRLIRRSWQAAVVILLCPQGSRLWIQTALMKCLNIWETVGGTQPAGSTSDRSTLEKWTLAHYIEEVYLQNIKKDKTTKTLL